MRTSCRVNRSGASAESPLNSKTGQDIPSEWSVWFESGYILCKRDELEKTQWIFYSRVVKLFDCKIIMSVMAYS